MTREIMKFKKGDKVRAISKSVWGESSLYDLSKPLYITGVKPESGVDYKCHPNKEGQFCDYFMEKDLILWEKTMDDLEFGDVLVDDKGDKCKVLGICGLVYFLSFCGDFHRASSAVWTLEELKAEYTLESETQPEEMTVADVEKALGKKVKIVKG